MGWGYDVPQRVLDSLGLEFQSLGWVGVLSRCGCRKLNMGPLQGQRALLTAEPYLEHRDFYLVASCPATSGLPGCRLGHMT